MGTKGEGLGMKELKWKDCIIVGTTPCFIHEVEGINKLKLELKYSKMELKCDNIGGTLKEIGPKFQGLFEWKNCQMDKGDKKLWKRKMLHLWFHYIEVGGHPTKGEREWTPPIKTSGEFGSSIGCLAKEENHGNKSNCRG